MAACDVNAMHVMQCCTFIYMFTALHDQFKMGISGRRMQLMLCLYVDVVLVCRLLPRHEDAS